jgi:hypothetical protein
MVNRVILIGNLTKDAESLPSSGKPMTRMRLATNSIWRDSEANRLNRPSSASIGGPAEHAANTDRANPPALVGGPGPSGADAPTA